MMGKNVRLVDHAGRGANMDSLEPWQIVTTAEHAEIHEGKHFFVNGFVVLTTGASLDFGFTTPTSAAGVAHLTFQIQGAFNTEFYVYEDAVFSGGAAVTVYNNNRNSVNSTGMTLVSDPGINTTGTLLESAAGGSAGGFFSPGQSALASREKELILKANTDYLFRMTSQAASNTISYGSQWYELDKIA